MADTTPSSVTADATVPPIPALVVDPAIATDAPAAVEPDKSTPAETAEAKTVEPAEQTDAADDDQPRDKAGKFAKRVEKIQQTIDGLTSQKYAVQAEVQRLEARAAKLRADLEASPTHDPNDFAAADAHRVRTAIKAEQAEQVQAEAEFAQQRAAELRLQTFTARVDAAAENIPDIRQAMETFGRLPLSAHAADVIADSPKAAEIAYHLAKNPDTAFRLHSLSPAQQGAELARIEARLTVAPQVRKTTAAPPPTPTLGGSRSPAVKDAADMSVAELQAYLNKGKS